jgi:hypothetical protein
MNQQIPHKLVLEEEPDPLPCNFRRTKYSSTEGTVSQGKTSHIIIPNGRNQYINCKNSFLNFSVVGTLTGTTLPQWPLTAALAAGVPAGAVTNGYNVSLDPMGLAMCIKRVTVRSNNLQVYDLDDYNKVYASLMVAQANYSSCSIRSICGGSTFAETGSAAGALRPRSLTNQFGNPNPGSNNTGTLFITPVMSASIPLLGLMGNAILPMTELSQGLELIIEWTNNAKSLFLNTADLANTTLASTIATASLEISDVSYDAAVTIQDDASQLAISSENQSKTEPLMWNDKYYRLNKQILTTAELTTNTEVTRIIPGARYTSLCAMYAGAFVQPLTEATSGDGRNNKNWESNYIPHIFFNKLRYRIGGQENPKNWIDSKSQMGAHTQACSANNGPTTAASLMDNDNTQINFRSTAVPTSASEWLDRGVVGVNFESFPEISNISGIDSMNVDVEVQYSTGAPDTTRTVAPVPGLPLQSCFISQYDVTYVVENGNIRRAD